MKDAWIDASKKDPRDKGVGIVGYEIPFNRHFYQYERPRSLEEIDADEYEHKYLWYVTNVEGVWIRGGSAQPYVVVPKSIVQRWPFPPLEEQTQLS